MPLSIIVFTRLPVPGKAKTRLIPELGPEGAAALQQRMTRLAVARAASRCRAVGGRLVVAYEGGDEAAMREWLGPGPRYRAQEGGDLGERMRLAARREFADGEEKVLIVGSDCPRLESRHLREAEEALEERDLVFGPARDGGYYLLGLRRDLPEVFEGIPWGGGGVLETSLRRAAEGGVEPALLETLPDVDLPADLADAEEALAASGRVSVVVPALDEEENLRRLLPALEAAGAYERIVVDGGSGDNSGAAAREAGAIVIEGLRGRAAQMNAGAAHASGELLLFLHADTVPPRGWVPLVRASLDRAEVAAGAFGFSLEGELPATRCVERLVDLRCRLFSLPYGDQGLFLRRDLFEALGGFPEQPILEDLALVRRLRRLGEIDVLQERAATSDRRWREGGVLRTFLRHQAILLGDRLGFSPECLARLR